MSDPIPVFFAWLWLKILIATPGHKTEIMAGWLEGGEGRGF